VAMISRFWEPGQYRLEPFLRLMRAASHARQSYAPIRTLRLPKSGADADWLDLAASRETSADGSILGSDRRTTQTPLGFAGRSNWIAAPQPEARDQTSLRAAMPERFFKFYQSIAQISNKSRNRLASLSDSEALATIPPLGLLVPPNGPRLRSEPPLVSLSLGQLVPVAETRSLAPGRADVTVGSFGDSTPSMGQRSSNRDMSSRGWRPVESVPSSTQPVQGDDAARTQPFPRAGGPRDTQDRKPTGQQVLHLDGAALGRWAIQHLERSLSRPANGITGIDPRATSPRGHVSPF
jgi:hypothetical protein